jgi:hypothetical protein
MFDKIKKLAGSIRFWIFTLGAAAAFLATVEMSGFSLANLFTAIASWLTVVGVTGGLDKWFEKKPTA